MNENKFFRYELRTTDPQAARAFYADVLGTEFWESDVVSVVRVFDLESSLNRVRASGGSALEPVATAQNDIVAPCDDPQDGAFALYEFRRQLA